MEGKKESGLAETPEYFWDPKVPTFLNHFLLHIDRLVHDHRLVNHVHMMLLVVTVMAVVAVLRRNTDEEQGE